MPETVEIEMWSDGRLKVRRDDFDHFIVYAEYEGVKFPVGKVHNSGTKTTNSYIFIDSKLSDLPGSVVYSVLPVFKNYGYGRETQAPPFAVKHPSYNVNFWAHREKVRKSE